MLVKQTLIDALRTIDPEKDDVVAKMATAIDDYIKSATITVPVIPVQVAVPSGTGATTAPVTATIQ
ncbi:MAG: hypothetical protein IJL44_07475 [Bacteroidales bacterium]|nr:hypothetical protein [Bacteroidales bacterium]